MANFLFLVRHADAINLADDAARPLSPFGRQQIAALGRLLSAQRPFQPDAIWHSPLVRARETAELLKEHLKLDAPLSEHVELIPEADPAAVAAKAEKVRGALALVGHEPHMSGLASLLVTGQTHPSVFIVKKAAIIALEPAGRRWQLHWHLSPDIVG